MVRSLSGPVDGSDFKTHRGVCGDTAVFARKAQTV